jgi:AcrR family transcriptional regulator
VVIPGDSNIQTRQRLLEAAGRLFHRNGFTATSLEDIADKAGVSVGAAYSHFAGKEELFLSFVERYRSVVDTSVVADPSRPAQEHILQLADRVAEMLPSAPEDVAMDLELKAFALRNPRARQALADSILAEFSELLAGTDDLGDGTRCRLTLLETVIVGQALAEGLTMLRAFVPEAITQDLFEAAFGLLIVDPTPNEPTRIEEEPHAAE